MIKLGSVPFINAKPLTYAIENNLIVHDFTVSLVPPAELSQKLQKKEIDVGLIPVAELLQRNKYKVVPGISISSYGEVDSVILITKPDIKDIKTVAIDKRSQSSTALLKIILEIFYGLTPEYVTKNINTRDYLEGVDGAMVIGNSGLRLRHAPPSGYKMYDLGLIWTKETGLPFVYAVYATNGNMELGNSISTLLESKTYGLNIVDKISRIESVNLEISEEICYKYLSERINYDLGEEEIKGIIKYSELLRELGQCEKINSLNIYSS